MFETAIVCTTRLFFQPRFLKNAIHGPLGFREASLILARNWHSENRVVLGFVFGKGVFMSRFIFYSGLVHCVAFVGVVTYMSTRPKESLPGFLQSTPHVDTTSSREIIEMGVASGSTARQEVAQNDSDRELRERKVRANLPTPPETPRVVDKVNAAKKVPSDSTQKVPSELPPKKGAKNSGDAATVNSVPEMGQDIPVEQTAVAAGPKTADDDLEKTAAEVAGAVADEAANESEISEETEKLQMAAFDVDKLAENHLQKLKDKEELEHKDRMAKLNAEKQAALLAMAQEQEDAEAAVGSKSGSASGTLTEDSAPTAAPEGLTSQAGGAEGMPDAGDVRALSEIRQSPGNRAPKYDVDDRRQGRAGLVVFLAYIKNDGYPKEFQLAASSGHRSLDAKTLKALKAWKFQPGQEGWVEIPFQWDLKGGAQEAPSNLRRQGSRQ